MTPRLQRSYVETTFGQVHVRQCGAGPALVLIHQMPSSGRQFEAAFDRLAGAGFRVVAIDVPGYGMSDPLPDRPTIEAYASTILSVVDALGVAELALLGHHTGASIACELTCLVPRRVSRLILNGTPIYRPEERDALLARWRQQEVPITEDGSHLLEPWLRRLAVSIGWTDLKAMTRNVVEMLSVRDREWLGFVAAFNYDMRARLSEISVPTLVLTNTGDDLYGLTQRARRYRPDFAYVELTGGTHDIVDEQPGPWSDAVLTFLGR